jgi:hypothetical protein
VLADSPLASSCASGFRSVKHLSASDKVAVCQRLLRIGRGVVAVADDVADGVADVDHAGNAAVADPLVLKRQIEVVRVGVGRRGERLPRWPGDRYEKQDVTALVSVALPLLSSKLLRTGC